MNLEFLFKGLALGLAIAAPVGPIGILCIRRSLNYGWLPGFISGLGAATADSLYGCIAAFGLTIVADFLVSQQLIIHLVGGLFLCYLGVKTFLSSVSSEAAKTEEIQNLVGNYLSTFFLTITNPMTILSFVVIFAGLGIVQTTNAIASSFLVLGVFLGSALWWIVLAVLANSLRHKLNGSRLQWINRIAGVMIISFGLVTLAELYQWFRQV